ncbi:MAG TPA: J domain-containing protein [Candidatus Dormibacteraeota bacterium]|nr:J domain-containing protein [Candidatus Dormibacteraeota bacterium]
MSASRDPYEVLGVPRNASTRQIRAAYVSRARRAHPDLVGTRGLDVMRALNEAWAVLKDEARRAQLDFASGTRGTGGGAGTPASGAASGPRRDDPNVPFWTGAHGPAPGRPHGSVLDFGIFAGWSLGEIMRRDRGYLMWLRDRAEGEPYAAEIARLLESSAAEQPEQRPYRRRS